MVKIISSLILVFGIIGVFRSQELNEYSYKFSKSLGNSLISLVSPDTLVFPGASLNTELLSTANSSFEFIYLGQSYNEFTVSPSGWLGFGSLSYSPLGNNLSDVNASDIIAPFWGDGLQTDFNQYITSEIIGTYPNRKLVIDYNLVGTLTGWNQIHFQVWLSETTNTIDYVYDYIPISTSFGDDYSIGLNGIVNGQLNIGSLVVQPNNMNSTIQYAIGSSFNSNISDISAGTKFSFNPYVSPPVNLSFPVIDATCLTLQWEDNSDNETYFEIYRSTGTGYTLIDTVNTNSTISTGAIFSYMDSDLQISTNYLYRVKAKNLVSLGSDNLFGSTTTSISNLSGIKQIPGDYVSLTEAIADTECKGIADTLIFELQANYSDSLEVFPINFSFGFNSNTPPVIVRVASNALNIVIGDSVDSPIIQFDNTANVFFDGKVNGPDDSNLLIYNKSRNRETIHLGLAKDIVIKNINVKGAVSNNLYGVVNFGQENVNNPAHRISLVNLNLSGINSVGDQLIRSATPWGYNDSMYGDILIKNCKLSDYQYTGLSLFVSKNKWIIDSCSFYQSHDRNLVSPNNLINDIYLKGSSDTVIIKDCFFGGKEAYCAGDAFRINGVGSYTSLKVSYLDTTGFIRIEGNTYANYEFNGNSSGERVNLMDCGFNNEGTFEILNNEIGNFQDTSSIVLNKFGVGLISMNFSTSKKIKIENNLFGGIKTDSSDIYLIKASGAVDTLKIINNKLGNDTINNSIVNATPYSNYTSFQGFHGMQLGGESILIEGNILANIYTNIFEGIKEISNGNCAINNNTLKDIHSSGHLTGIYASGATNIEQNWLSRLESSNGNVYGIKVINGEGFVDNNFVSNLVCGINKYLRGMYLEMSNSKIYNNVISLGYDSQGDVFQSQYRSIDGVYFAGSHGNYFAHNSVSIDGPDSTSTNCGCVPFEYTATFDDTLVNNIFINKKPVSGITAVVDNHILDYNNPNTAGYINNNLYYSSSYDSTYANNWMNSLPVNQNSIYGEANFDNPGGNGDSTDLHISGFSRAESGGVGLNIFNIDIDGETRNALTPDIGADEFTNILGPNNVSLLSIDSISSGCDSLRMVYVTIANHGSDTLLTFDVNLAVNNVDSVSQWVGVLPPLDTASCVFGPVNINTFVPNLLKVILSNPNQGIDLDPYNNNESISYNKSTYLDLGLDLDTCLSTTYNMTISAYDSAYVDYHWNTGSMDSAIVVFHSVGSFEDYEVIVQTEDFYNCSQTDSVNVKFNHFENLNLINNVNYCSESQDTVIYSALDTNLLNYLWSNGDTTASIQLIHSSPSNDQIFGLTLSVTDTNQCKVIDTAQFAFRTVDDIDLGPDITSCSQTYHLDAYNPSYDYYLWNGTFWTSFFDVYAPGGTISLQVGSNGCYKSDTIIVTLSDCSNIDEYVDYGLNVFPNPGREKLIIEADYQGCVNMFDINGNIVKSKKINYNKIEFDLIDLERGTYFIVVGEIRIKYILI